jgi:hypothetical protein
MKINAHLTPDFAFFSFFIGFGQLFSITAGRFIGKYHALSSYIFMVIIPYIYIVFVRGYFIRKDFMLDEVIIKINAKLITDNNLGKIIEKKHLNYPEPYLVNNDYSTIMRYYVTSRGKPTVVIRNLKYYGITNPSTDFEISDYEMWKQLEIEKMYRLRYYKYDNSKIILQAEEFKYQDELNKYLINDLSNIIVGYLGD